MFSFSCKVSLTESFVSFLCLWSLGSSALQFRAERIKIPPTRYPRSAGSDRGTDEFASLHCLIRSSMLRVWIHTFLLCLSRLPFTLGMQQPDTTNVPRQPGDNVFHQRPITELHFHPAQDISQPCSSWWQAEGWVSKPLVPIVMLLSFNMTCFLLFVCNCICFIVI